MSMGGDLCSKLHDVPAAVLCVLIFLLQAAAMDIYLISNLSINHLSWIGPDLVNLTVLVISIVGSYTALHRTSFRGRSFFSLAWLSWLLMSMSVSAKTIVIFNEFAASLVEQDPTFFGPNTLKTAIALSSCVFFLLLTTQHNAPIASERRRYIEELTGTVVFDILDTVDILEILFKQEKVDTFWLGLREFILAVASLNLMLPTIPLITLCKTKFGHEKLDKRLIHLHRLMVVLAVNFPNLLVRLFLWNVFSAAISPFTLKNLILIVMALCEFYEHRKVKKEESDKQGSVELDKTKGRLPTSINSDRTNTCSDRKYSSLGFPIEDRVVKDI